MGSQGFARLLVATLLLGSASCGIAYAQFQTPSVGGKFKTESGFYADVIPTIPVRAAGHKDFSRLVFDWPTRVSYELKEIQKGTLEFEFQRRALVDMGGVRMAPETNFSKIEVVSGLRDHLRIRVAVPPDASYKHYNLGYKIILDVSETEKRIDTPAAAAKPAAVPSAAPAPQAANAPKPLVPPVAAVPTPATAPIVVKPPVEVPAAPTVAPAIATPAAPATTERGASMSFGWTATAPFAVASFIRNGFLYMVTDSEDPNFAPRVSVGTMNDDAIQRIPSKDGQVYRVALPIAPGSEPPLQAGGGNMAWSFTVNPDGQPKQDTATLQRDAGGEHSSLLINLPKAEGLLPFYDPDTGETITAVLVPDAGAIVRQSYHTPEFDLLPGGAGFAVRRRSDQIDVKIEKDNVRIASPRGLILDVDPAQAQGDPVAAVTPPQPAAPDTSSLASRVFYFDRWLLGLPREYDAGRQELENRLSKAPPERKAEAMIALAKYQMAYGFAPESLGYLEMAETLVPQMAQDPEFRALRGAALTVLGDGNAGLKDLNDPSLNAIPEMGMWRSYAAAENYDWDDAFAYMPTDLTVLRYYPQRLRSAMTLSLTETLLRSGRAKEAETLIGTLAGPEQPLTKHEQAARDYLMGEAKRLQNEPVKAVEYWNKAEASTDQLYRVKATLAKTVLQLQQRAVKPEEAIERLERLRFAWRGDGLETQIAQVLGRLYLTNKKWDSAFELMRDAAGFAAGSEEGNAIAAAMTQAFAQLYTNPPPDLTPLDAIALYDRYPELTPAGEEGKAVQRSLAQFLLQADLLDRAGGIYEKLIPQDTGAVEVLNDGLQLAAVRLLARQPDQALEALDMPELNVKGTDRQMRQKALLRARALSDLKKPDDALKILAALPVGMDSLSLMADTAWAAARWDMAAQSYAALLARTDTAREQFTPEQTKLVTNQAIALSLANKLDGLADMRSKYMTKLKDDNFKRQFDAITRPNQTPTLADRATLLKMANEIDLFATFLEDARKAPTESAPVAAAPATDTKTQAALPTPEPAPAADGQ